MDGDPDSLEETLHLDFALARLELTEAVRELRTADTADSRRRVDECRARVDDVLDMWNDVLLTSAC
ncbi:hypothetical protein [Geodermatophilus sp. SYSU D00815]